MSPATSTKICSEEFSSVSIAVSRTVQIGRLPAGSLSPVVFWVLLVFET